MLLPPDHGPTTHPILRHDVLDRDEVTGARHECATRQGPAPQAEAPPHPGPAESPDDGVGQQPAAQSREHPTRHGGRLEPRELLDHDARDAEQLQQVAPGEARVADETPGS